MVRNNSNEDYTEAARRLKEFPPSVFSSGTLWSCQPAKRTCCHLGLSLLRAECPSTLVVVGASARELLR